MTLPVDVELRLHILSDAKLMQWDENGILDIGQREQTSRKREEIQWARMAREIGAENSSMPVEQVELWRTNQPFPSSIVKNMGLTGGSIAFLANRYCSFTKGFPSARFERLAELQEAKSRIVLEQLACWTVAYEMRQSRSADTVELAMLPNLDWPGSLAFESPFLEKKLSREMVDGHVHLGGVLGTLELWPELLDPRVKQGRKDAINKWTQYFGDKQHLRIIVLRLKQMRQIRDILSLELAGIGATMYKVVGVHVDNVMKRFQDQIKIEHLFPSQTSLSNLGIKLTDIDPVPLALSHWWATHREKYQPSHVVISERAFLVRCFGAITGLYREQPAPWFGRLFSMYLTCQNLFHQAVTQQGRRVGLGHFLHWYDHPARGFFFCTNKVRQERVLHVATKNWKIRVEGRVSPDPNVIRSWIRAFHLQKKNRKEARYAELGKDFGLVVHFIKQKDQNPRNRIKKEEMENSFFLRHRSQRKKYKRQAIRLEQLRNRDEEVARAVLGIDAARAETDTQPEVFAPTFRYLRRSFPSSKALGRLYRSRAEYPEPLRATFHIGESFHHPLTGLRRMHEAINFLNLGPGDRLGHGMVLGIDPKQWLDYSGPPARMTLEEHLDNMVWMAWLLKGTPHEKQLPQGLQQQINHSFQFLYDDTEVIPRPHTLEYLLGQAWELRWMDPEETLAILTNLGWSNAWPTEDYEPDTLVGNLHCPYTLPEELKGNYHSAWNPVLRDLPPNHLSWRFNSIDTRLFQGEMPKASLRYLWRYNYDRGYFSRGQKTISSEEMNLNWMPAFEPLRERVISEIQKREITIEACPTSNIMIGGLKNYAEHPVFKLNPRGLKQIEKNFKTSNYVPVTINTDDSGVFATSLENELALLARTAQQQGETMDDILAWIENLRQQGKDRTFLKSSIRYNLDSTQKPPYSFEIESYWKEKKWFKLIFEDTKEEKLTKYIKRDLLGI